jgi:glycosyltransferase involved in cell wall biosynthesis
MTHRLELRGRLPPAEAAAAARSATAFVLPSIDEAFGVAYVEAMAGGVPAIGCRGEPGPEEIAASGGGIRLVPAGEPEAIAAELRQLLSERRWRRELGEAARANVAAHFTWAACGRATVEAYEDVLAGRS